MNPSKFRPLLKEYFRIMGQESHDNLPILARQLRNGGRAALANVMNGMGVENGIEIGTRWGHSAELWCKSIPGLRLTCIDPYVAYHTRTSQEKQNEVYEGAKEWLEPYGVNLIRKSSQSPGVYGRFAEESVDFINIDGDHTFDAVIQDILYYVPKVKPGGLILIHDYCAFKHSGVMQAVDAYTHCHRIDPWYVTKDDNPTAFWQKGAERI